MSEAQGVARDQLRSIVQRIERLEEEKKALSDDIREAIMYFTNQPPWCTVSLS